MRATIASRSSLSFSFNSFLISLSSLLELSPPSSLVGLCNSYYARLFLMSSRSLKNLSCCGFISSSSLSISSSSTSWKPSCLRLFYINSCSWSLYWLTIGAAFLGANFSYKSFAKVRVSWVAGNSLSKRLSKMWVSDLACYAIDIMYFSVVSSLIPRSECS